MPNNYISARLTHLQHLKSISTPPQGVYIDRLRSAIEETPGKWRVISIINSALIEGGYTPQTERSVERYSLDYNLATFRRLNCNTKIYTLCFVCARSLTGIDIRVRSLSERTGRVRSSSRCILCDYQFNLFHLDDWTSDGNILDISKLSCLLRHYQIREEVITYLIEHAVVLSRFESRFDFISNNMKEEFKIAVGEAITRPDCDMEQHWSVQNFGKIKKLLAGDFPVFDSIRDQEMFLIRVNGISPSLNADRQLLLKQIIWLTIFMRGSRCFELGEIRRFKAFGEGNLYYHLCSKCTGEMVNNTRGYYLPKIYESGHPNEVICAGCGTKNVTHSTTERDAYNFLSEDIASLSQLEAASARDIMYSLFGLGSFTQDFRTMSLHNLQRLFETHRTSIRSSINNDRAAEIIREINTWAEETTREEIAASARQREERRVQQEAVFVESERREVEPGECQIAFRLALKAMISARKL
jgi:hypothetical protein